MTEKIVFHEAGSSSFSEFLFTSFVVWIDADYDCTCNGYKNGIFFSIVITIKP